MQAYLNATSIIRKEKGKLCVCKNRSKGKVIAITGANSGIGYETALHLAFLDAKIYLCCRNEILGRAAVDSIIKKSGNCKVYFISLDLSSFDSCHQCANSILEDEPKLDVLIHNAGIFHVDPSLTDDGFEVTSQTNFLGPVVLTENLFPLLLESPSSKLIFVNSDAHKIPSLQSTTEINLKKIPWLSKFEDYVLHYGISKLALKLYATYIADFYKDFGLNVASVNPGNVWTAVYKNCWVHWYQQPIRWLCSLFMRSPLHGAQGIIHAVNVENLTTGSYIEDCCERSMPDDEETFYACDLMKKVYSVLDQK